MKRFFLSVSAVFIFIWSTAQEFSSFKSDQFSKDDNYGYFNFIQLNTHAGNHASESEFMEHIFSNGYKAISLRVGTQSTGRQQWQRLHNYPQYGLGVAVFDLGGAEADSSVGAPSALFFYFGAPWARFGNFSLNTDIELGLSYDFNPYDPEINEFQDVIASRTNLHFNLILALYYHLSERIDLNTGFELIHFSNGRTFSPQRGINLAGLTLGASYHFNPMKNYTKSIDPNYKPPIRPQFIIAEKPDFRPHHELQFTTAAGTVQARPGDWKNPDGIIDTTGAIGPRYLTSTLSVDYAYQVKRKVKLNTGFDFFYDGSAEYLYIDKLPGETTFTDKSFYGYHVGFQYLIERFAFIYNLGTYLHKPFPQRGSWYMRVGGKIGLSDKIDAHIVLKTRNGGIADWIEWGITYKLKLGKQ